MNKKLLILFTLPLLMGCTSITPSKEPDPDPPDPPIIDPSVIEEDDHLDDEISPNLNKANDVYNKLFTYGNKIEFTLDFTNQALLKLQEYGEKWGNNDNFVKNEMYHPCTLTLKINDDTSIYYEVGARMRGNTSRVNNFIANNGFFTGQDFHFKLNFAQTFDDSNDNDYFIHKWIDKDKKAKREDRKIGKMKKLDFKFNRNHDGTFTKELYALDAFRNNGVLAQHANLVKVTINSESDSRTLLYTMYESVDKQLLKKAYPSDYSGDLYKCLYQASKADLTNTDNLGVERQGFNPTYSLKTNEDSSDMSQFKTLINKINTKSISGEEYYQLVKDYIDVDYFINYSALCWVFGLPDDLRNNANNYYLYFNKDNKAIFLPYDNDRCLGIRNNWDIDLKNTPWNHTEGVYGWNDCPLIHRFLDGGSNNSHKVYDVMQNQFHQLCINYANDILDVNKFETFTKQFEGIAPSVDINNAGDNNDTFAIYANAKKETLNQ